MGDLHLMPMASRAVALHICIATLSASLIAAGLTGYGGECWGMTFGRSKKLRSQPKAQRLWLKSTEAIKSVLFLLSIVISSKANAFFYSYFEWQALPTRADKSSYISGSYDSYMTFSAGYPKTAQFFDTCVSNLHINNGQLTDGVEAYAVAHPSEQGFPVPALMLKYLVAVCGTPPSEK